MEFRKKTEQLSFQAKRPRTIIYWLPHKQVLKQPSRKQTVSRGEKMFEYLKTFYQAMKFAAYYDRVGQRTPAERFRQEMLEAMNIRS